MRKIISAMQISLDGFIEGPMGEIDWIESWEDTYDIMSRTDTLILGGKMYPGYEQYWCSILKNPKSVSPFTGKVATEGEIAYANFADKTPHYVLSSTITEVNWGITRIIRDIEVIRQMKNEPGKDIYIVGGANLVSSLLNIGLIDELRLTVHPVLIGGGKTLFNNIKNRHSLILTDSEVLKSGSLSLVYQFKS